LLLKFTFLNFSYLCVVFRKEPENVRICTMSLINLKSGNQKRRLTRGVLSVLLGITIMVYPGLTLNIVVSIIGALLLAYGLINYFIERKTDRPNAPGLFLIPSGIGSIVFGVLFLLFPGFIAKAFVFLIGFILLIVGITQVAAQLNVRQKTNFSYLFIIIGVLASIGGIVLIAKPFESASALLAFFGALVSLLGCGEILFSLRAMKRAKVQKTSSDIIDVEYEEV